VKLPGIVVVVVMGIVVVVAMLVGAVEELGDRGAVVAVK
jgi:hypothetical protein